MVYGIMFNRDTPDTARTSGTARKVETLYIRVHTATIMSAVFFYFFNTLNA